MVRIFFVLLFAVHSSLLWAQGTGDIRGTVKSEDGKNLKSAQVTIKGTKLGALVSESGYYLITNVPAGEQQVTVLMTGYEPLTRKVTVVAGQDVVLDFRLKARVADLEPVEVRAEVPKRVVTATMVEMEIEKIPSAVEIITEEEIEEMGALTVADALMESQSLYLQGDNERSLSASLRGLRTTHTLVLIDGRRVAAGLRGNIELDDIPTAMIEQIEIVRGPSSALYGSDAIGGVINIITKQPTKDAIAGMAVRYGQSKYGEAQNPFLKGYLSEKKGRMGYSLSASVDKKNKYDRYENTVWTDGDKKSFRSGTGLVSFDLTPNHMLKGGFDLSRVDRKGIRPYLWGDGKRQAITSRKSYFLEYNGEFWKYSNLVLRAYQYNFETDIDIFPVIFGYTTNPLTQSEDPYNLSQELNQVEGRWSHLFLGRHMVTLGAESRLEKRIDKFSDNEVSNSAYFFQNVCQVAKPLLLVFGARYDSHSDFGTALSPKMSLTLSLQENFRLKSSYGHGIRAPSIFELYIESPTKESLIRPNLDLGAEKSRSYEFGVEGEYEGFSGVIRFFRNDLTDMINTVQVGMDTLFAQKRGGGLDRDRKPWTRPVLQFTNIAEAMTQGFEISASVKLPRGFVLSDDATVIETKDKTTGRRLLNKPNLLNNAKLEYENPRLGVKANIRASTVGSRIISDAYEAEAYTFIHLYASKKLADYMEVYAGINNVLNNDPNIFGYLEGAGSTGTFFYCGLTLELRERQ